MVNPLLQQADSAYSRQRELLGQLDYNPIMPESPLPDKNAALRLLAGQALSGLLGAQGVDTVGSYMQGKQLRSSMETQKKQQSQDANNKKIGQEIDLLGAEAQRLERRSELLQMQFDRLADNYRMAKSPGQLSAARNALNAAASEMGRPEFVIDDAAFQMDLSSLGTLALKSYSEEAGRVADRYGNIPTQLQVYFDTRRKRIADDYYGGNTSLVPEALSADTLKARQFEFTKKEADRKFKFLSEKERTRIAEKKADLELRKRQLSIMERNSATAEGRADIARLKYELDADEFDYKKSLPKEAQFDGEINSAMNAIKQKRISQKGESKLEKRQELEVEIKNLQKYVQELTLQKKDPELRAAWGVGQAGQIVPNPVPKVDNRMVGNTGMTRSQLLEKARSAIQSGAPRDQVIRRLRGMGISETP